MGEEERYVYQFRHYYSQRDRKKARKQLRRFLKSRDEEARILAIEARGPTKLELFKSFIMEYPFTSAIVVGFPSILGLYILVQYSARLLGYKI